MDTRIWSFHEPHATILADQLRLRGSLVPFVYTLAWRAHAVSFPFVRPMWWDWPDADAAGGLMPEQSATQYMFGGVLVRPVAEWQTNETDVDVWLPEGTSWSSWDGSTLFTAPRGGGGGGGGGQLVRYHATLADTPLFVSAGLAVPMWPPGRREAAVPPAARPTVWAVWDADSAGDGSGVHYEDDGETLVYEGDGGGSREDGDGSDRTAGGGGGGVASSLTTLNYTWSGDDGTPAAATTATTLRATIRTVGSFDGAPRTKRHALQLRGLDAAVAVIAGQPRHRSSPLQISSASCGGVPLPELRTRGSYDTPGWWRQSAAEAESACPAKAVVVICPQLDRAETVEVAVSFVAPFAALAAVEAS